MFKSNINYIFSKEYGFHDEEIKSMLESDIYSLESTLNRKDIKEKIILDIYRGVIVDGKATPPAPAEIKNNHEILSVAVSVFSSLIEPILENDQSMVIGNMKVSYDGKFYVAGFSPIPSIRNFIYNVICASVLFDLRR